MRVAHQGICFLVLCDHDVLDAADVLAFPLALGVHSVTLGLLLSASTTPLFSISADLLLLKTHQMQHVYRYSVSLCGFCTYRPVKCRDWTDESCTPEGGLLARQLSLPVSVALLALGQPVLRLHDVRRKLLQHEQADSACAGYFGHRRIKPPRIALQHMRKCTVRDPTYREESGLLLVVLEPGQPLLQHFDLQIRHERCRVCHSFQRLPLQPLLAQHDTPKPLHACNISHKNFSSCFALRKGTCLLDAVRSRLTFFMSAARSWNRATSRSSPSLAALCFVSSASSTWADCTGQQERVLGSKCVACMHRSCCLAVTCFSACSALAHRACHPGHPERSWRHAHAGSQPSRCRAWTEVMLHVQLAWEVSCSSAFFSINSRWML